MSFKLSKALTAEKIATYYETQYVAPSEAQYYTRGGQIVGQFHGGLAAEFGLSGQEATQERVERLAKGQHPETGEQLIKHRAKAQAEPWEKTTAAWRAHLEEQFVAAFQAGRNLFREVKGNEAWAAEKLRVPAGGLQLRQRDDHQLKLIEIQETAAKFYRDNLLATDPERIWSHIQELDADSRVHPRLRISESQWTWELANHLKERGYSTAESGAAYLKFRKVTAEIAAEFRLGVASNGNELLKHLREKGYTEDLLRQSGLFAQSEDGRLFDLFRDRVMVPIQDGCGDVIALGGRILDDSTPAGKWINSANTAIYDKGRDFFNLHRAAEAAKDSGILVEQEGYFDAIASHQAGVRNVFTLSGTALAKDARDQLRGAAHTIILNLDGDEPGKKATEKHIAAFMSAGFRVRAVSFDGDPDEFIQANGEESFRASIKRARPLVEWLANRAQEKFSVRDVYGKIDAIRWMAEQLGNAAPEYRRELADELGRYLQTPETDEQKKKFSEHRAGVDGVFTPPKSVSCQALVPGTVNGEVASGDQRIIELHNRAVRSGLDALQEFVQARERDQHPTTTGNWCAALFLHDVARPLADDKNLVEKLRSRVNSMQDYVRAKAGANLQYEGFTPNPLLHTHSVIFNMTRNGETISSMDPNSLYIAQTYANSIYMSEIMNGLREMGYGLQQGKGFAMEIEGYSEDYLRAMSLRSEDIEAIKKEKGLEGAAASEIINLSRRKGKQDWEPGKLREVHRLQAEYFGVNTASIQAQARERGGYQMTQEYRRRIANEAMDYAKARLYEGQAVNERFELIRDALRYKPHILRKSDIETAMANRKSEFVKVEHYRNFWPQERYTTPEMQRIERDSIELVLKGQGKTQPIIKAEALDKWEFKREFGIVKTARGEIELNRDQLRMAWTGLTSTNQFFIVSGAAGVGKSSSFKIIAKLAEQHRQAGYKIVGLAATSTATNNLRELGIDSLTLQKHNMIGVPPGAARRLYMLDEGSLVGSPSFHQFIKTVRSQDRVIIAYDHRQHHSVEAGRIIWELEQAGIETIRMDKIERQRENPELQAVVQKFANAYGHRGSKNMIEGLQMMRDQHRLWNAPDKQKRYEGIAAYYIRDWEHTLAVSPDNKSLEEISIVIRERLKAEGYLKGEAYQAVVLVGQRGMHQADKSLAKEYLAGNVIYFSRDTGLEGRGRIARGTYATVTKVDAAENEITVKFGDRLGVREISFDPRLIAKQAEVYNSDVKEFMVGEKIQITRPWRVRPGLEIANGDIGKILEIDQAGKALVEFDGQQIKLDMQEMPHFDWGYAMTSYRAQSKTVDRVVLNVETQNTKIRGLLEKALAYVGVSRGAQDAVVFTDDVDTLLDPELSPILKQHDKPLALSDEEIEDVAKIVRTVAVDEARVDYGLEVA